MPMREAASKSSEAAKTTTRPKAEHAGAAGHEGGEPAVIDRLMLARLRKAAAVADDDINLSDPDAPLVTDWASAESGWFFQPVKRLKSFGIDADVVAYFEGQGKGYQAAA